MRTVPIAARLLAILAMIIAGRAAIALEIGLEADASNLHLPWAPLTPIADTTFPPTNYFEGGAAWITAPLGEDASIRVSYLRDQITRNSLIAAVQFERGIARISVGPQIGFLNSDSAPFSAGLSASVRLQWQGVAYVSMQSEGGTAISILQAGTDPQAQTELAAGFYVPHAIVSAVVTAKRFNELDSSGILVSDSLTRYAMTVDIFKKNVPYTALLSLDYELRSKHYAYTPTDVTDSLGAIVLGIDSTIQLSRSFKLLAGISTGAYVFGLDSLQGRGPATSSFLFSARLGVSVDISMLMLGLASREERPSEAESPKEAKAESGTTKSAVTPPAIEVPAQAPTSAEPPTAEPPAVDAPIIAPPAENP